MACRSANDGGLFNLYVKFDWGAEPLIAIRLLSMACLELNGLHSEVYDRLNFMASTDNCTHVFHSQSSNSLTFSHIRYSIKDLLSF